MVNAGGVAAVVDYVGESKGNVRLPGVMMLGYVAAHSENLAMAVIVSKGVTQLAITLGNEGIFFRIRGLHVAILLYIA